MFLQTFACASFDLGEFFYRITNIRMKKLKSFHGTNEYYE